MKMICNYFKPECEDFSCTHGKFHDGNRFCEKDLCTRIKKDVYCVTEFEYNMKKIIKDEKTC